jgi:hypothetical protein
MARYGPTSIGQYSHLKSSCSDAGHSEHDDATSPA